jgi:predicted small lipoprotein YifL
MTAELRYNVAWIWMDTLMTAARIMVAIALMGALGTAAACGRKSELDTPYEAAVQARKDAKRAGEPLPPEPQKPVEDKPFILDKLIQ